jgi:hypothetical protein
MATNSKYVQLSNQVLLEYQYRNQGSTANELTTSQAPWYLMENDHDKTISIFNNDNSTNETGNVRTRMGVLIDSTTSKYGYLKLDQITALNDYDPKLTDTVDLPVTFSTTQNVAYDVIRLHLVQGFNYENNEGFFFRAGFDSQADQKVYHTNLAYRKADSYAKINPEPFILGGKYYASYVEILVPALYNLIEEFRDASYSGSPTGDLPSSRLTGGSGPKYSSLINVDFGWIKNNTTINGQNYYNVFDLVSLDLPVLDQFNDVSAVVQNSTQVDYIEFYAAYNGNIIDNFITQLNNAPGNDYIILHELNVYEHVWSGGATASWIQTSKLEFVQDSNYEDPVLYRPVIQNQAAQAYRLDYVIRLFNRDDNTSIWKTASAQFNNAAKYGKTLQKIALGLNPIQPKVYNKIYDKKVSMYNGADTTIGKDEASYAKFVTSFMESNQVLITSQNAYLQRDPNTNKITYKTVGNSQTETIFAQGLGKINLTSADTFLKFVIYQGDPQKVVKFLDLNGLGDMYLNFFTNSGEVKKFKAYQDPTISPSSGEVLFKIPADDSREVSKYNDNTFSITSNNGEAESQLYTGTFNRIEGTVSAFADRKITNLETQLAELNKAYNALRALYDTSVVNNNDLKSANKSQNTLIQDLQRALKQSIQENNFLLEDDEQDEIEKEELRRQIAELEALAATPPPSEEPQDPVNQPTDPITGAQIVVVDPSTPSQYVNAKKNKLVSSIKKSPTSPYMPKSNARPGEAYSKYDTSIDDREKYSRDIPRRF